MDLKTYWKPVKGTVYFRKLRNHDLSAIGIEWICTQEDNGYLVWRGQCLPDNDPSDPESEWKYEIIGFSVSRDNAVEDCVQAAIAEEQLVSKPRAKTTVAAFNGA